MQLDSSKRFAALMVSVQQGDADAFGELLREYGESIRREIRFTLLDRRLRRFVGDSDVYQSVVVRFFSGVRDGHFKIESSEELVRLLKGITHTRIAELVRYWHAQRRDLSRTDSLTDNSSVLVQDDQVLPLDALEFQEVVTSMEKALTPMDRQILRWRDEGAAWSEIAARLGAVSGEAARKQHERALALVAKQFTFKH
jgi:hypothetical protein